MESEIPNFSARILPGDLASYPQRIYCVPRGYWVRAMGVAFKMNTLKSACFGCHDVLGEDGRLLPRLSTWSPKTYTGTFQTSQCIGGGCIHARSRFQISFIQRWKLDWNSFGLITYSIFFRLNIAKDAQRSRFPSGFLWMKPRLENCECIRSTHSIPLIEHRRRCIRLLRGNSL